MSITMTVTIRAKLSITDLFDIIYLMHKTCLTIYYRIFLYINEIKC